MYEILLIMFIVRFDGGSAAIATNKIGNYDDIALCNTLAHKLARVGEVENKRFVVQAQCVQVKEKK